MEALVADISKRWGGWEGYADAVGIGPDLVARLRASSSSRSAAIALRLRRFLLAFRPAPRRVAMTHRPNMT